MRTVQVVAGTPIDLGYQYDNEATQVVFPSTITSTVTATFGSEGTFAIWVRRSGDAVGYPVASSAIDYEDGAVTWLVKEADLAMPGTAQVQLRYLIDETCVMSQMFSGNVNDSVDIGDEAPNPLTPWTDAIIEAAEIATDAASRAEAAASSAIGWPAEAKQKLLDLLAHVAYIDDDGQEYFDDLEDALYPTATVESISAVYTQSGTVMWNDSLDTLKSDLVVTAHYSDETSATISSGYSLSGTLEVGTNSTVTVTYGTKTTTFTVEVSEYLYIVSGSSLKRKKGLTGIYPYYGASNDSKRISYISFDLLLDGGKTYQIVATCQTDTSSPRMGCQFYNQNVLNTVATGQTFQNTDIYDPTWQTSYSDGAITAEIEVPSAVNSSPIKGVRFTFSLASDVTIPDGFTISNITIKEVAA